MSDCIFCKIIAGQIPSETVYKDEQVIAFKDIEPQAPVHLLIVPREHIATLQDIADAKGGIIEHMAVVANKLAQQTGVKDKGYRVIINTGAEGGQVVKHLHMHLLGGKMLGGRLG